MNAVTQLNAALAGRYTVDREIGAGGMATVYIARDIKHDRNVALKVLLPELGAILGVERFQSEIKVTANLQHPNLLPLFDSGEADGLLFYVMPFVEGESLRARLDREKQLPVDEALRIAGSVASALDYAHRHEVIHRDLKPENILLHDGQPLIADFGIALAVSKAGGARITQTGLSLGTPQYMSPEQATGDRIIDARADIYSLGAVTYEMLTGEPPHVGSTSQAIIARVLTEKTRGIRMSRPNVPEHVEAAVERALEKLPADRWATAKEFAEALVNERFAFAGGAVTSAKTAARRATKPSMSNKATIALTMVAALAGVIATKAAESWLKPNTVQRESRFVLALADSLPLQISRPGGSARIGMARDGSKIAFVTERGGARAIAIRTLSDPIARRIQGAEGGGAPFFSPDGEWLAFVAAAGKLMKVPVGGGTPVPITETGGPGSWGDDGFILYVRGNAIYRVSADGGAPTRVFVPDSTKAQSVIGAPQVLPGDEFALVTLLTSTVAQLAIVRISDGTATELGVPGFAPRYDGRGHLLFGRSDGILYAAPFSPRRRKLTGPIVPLIQGLQQPLRGLRADFGVASDGTLAFVTGSTSARQLMVVDRAGAARPITSGDRSYGWPRVSPDGRRVALEIGEPGLSRFDIWVYDIAPRTLIRLTHNSAGYRTIGWSGDGRRVLYVTPDSTTMGPSIGMSTVRSVPWDGSGSPDSLVTIPGRRLWEATIGPPHTWMILRVFGGGAANAGGDLMIAPLDTPAAVRPFLTSPANEITPRLSPDGRHVAYASDETGTNEVYVRPVPGPGGRLQVSNGGGVNPVWAPGGRELFYRSASHVVAASLSLGTEMTVRAREQLFDYNAFFVDISTQYDVLPSGREFVVVGEAPGTSSQVGVIINWQALLKKP